MKNFKKITREQLKQVQGGSGLPTCPVGYFYKCAGVGVCDPVTESEDCLCSCVPKPVKG